MKRLNEEQMLAAHLYAQHQVELFSEYRHIKNGTHYMTINLVFDVEAQCFKVCYRSLGGKLLTSIKFSREIDSFNQSFELVPTTKTTVESTYVPDL